MITFTELGLADQIERYVAYEYDVKSVGKKGAGEFGFPALVASHNFPNIEQRGDIFKADFTEFKGFDYILAGFPCTKFSIAQKKDRETKPYCGEGWDMFEKAWEAVQVAQPKFFLFENNKSMAQAVQEEISKIIGFKPIVFNSSLLSAQQRQRIYWLGKRNPDGTYSQVQVELPEDKGIILQDILEDGIADRDKSYCLKHQTGNARDYLKKHHTQVKFEPVAKRVPDYGVSDKSRPLGASYAYKGDGEGSLVSEAFPDNPNKQVRDYVAEPVSNFAEPVEWDEDGNPTIAVSSADGKKHKVYEVKRGFITFKGKEYKISLADGLYIIRKLTVLECMRLQTVPEWYDFSITAETHAYEMLGNGWTVEVIKHLINHTLE
jgi:DNA (cytosine-5)-methyltransferase 3A